MQSLEAYKEEYSFTKHDNSSEGSRNHDQDDSIHAKSHSSSPNPTKSIYLKTDPNNLHKKAGESTVIKKMGLMKIGEGGKKQEGLFDG